MRSVTDGFITKGPLIRLLPASLIVILLLQADGLARSGSSTSLPKPVERQVSLMGTRCRLLVYERDRKEGIEHIEGAIETLQETEAELSTWQPGSVLSRLNRQPLGKPFHLSGRLCRLFSQLSFWNLQTRGRFDPGVGALINAWGLRHSGKIPGNRELRRALSRTGWRFYRFDPAGCQVTRTRRVLIDAGAFGKGEGLDRVSVRVGNGRSWLIDLGGQIWVTGAPPDRRGWTVELSHPRHRDQPLLEVTLGTGSLATSGGSERDRRVNGRRVGHILNPQTGYPADFSGSVSVFHRRALVADILSTALYVMGPGTGLKWCRQHRIAALFLIPLPRPGDPGGVQVLPSRAFQKKFGIRPETIR